MSKRWRHLHGVFPRRLAGPWICLLSLVHGCRYFLPCFAECLRPQILLRLNCGMVGAPAILGSVQCAVSHVEFCQTVSVQMADILMCEPFEFAGPTWHAGYVMSPPGGFLCRRAPAEVDFGPDFSQVSMKISRYCMTWAVDASVCVERC